MYLIRCVLNDRIPAKEKLDKMDLSGVFAVAKAHSLTAIAAYALESVGIHDKAFEEEKNKAIRKEIILNAERERVFQELEKAGIWYLPLKGIIIKDLYPQIGMRQMADCDILIDKNFAEDVRIIMEKLEFTTEYFNDSNQDVYHKLPVCCFEMHTELFPQWFNDSLVTYYSNIKHKLITNNRNHKYEFSINDFYVFLVSHEYKHYSRSGTGLRSLIDTYVYLKQYGRIMDMHYIYHECSKLGISHFEKKNRELSIKLLSGKRLFNTEQTLFDYYVFSGTYGTLENHIRNKLNKDKNSVFLTVKYIKNRVLIPINRNNPHYNTFSTRYEWFYKSNARILLLFFYRIGVALTSSRNRVKAEIKAIKMYRK